MKYKHYAPVVPCIGARTPEAAVRIASRYPSAVVMGESEFVKAVMYAQRVFRNARRREDLFLYSSGGFFG